MDRAEGNLGRIKWGNLTPEQLEAEKVKGALGVVWDKDIANLKDAVEAHEGLIIALIHPYIEEYWPYDRTDLQKAPSVERLEARLAKFIGSDSRHKPPIFIFEEEQRLGKTRAREGLTTERGIYIVPTEHDESTPSFSYRGDTGESRGSWSELRQAFRYLGVKKILLGGMYPGDYEEKEERSLDSLSREAQRCVGSAWDALRVDFNVEISSMTYRLARKNIHPKPPRQIR